MIRALPHSTSDFGLLVLALNWPAASSPSGPVSWLISKLLIAPQLWTPHSFFTGELSHKVLVTTLRSTLIHRTSIVHNDNIIHSCYLPHLTIFIYHIPVADDIQRLSFSSCNASTLSFEETFQYNENLLGILVRH